MVRVQTSRAGRMIPRGRGMHLKAQEEPLTRERVLDAVELGEALRRRRRELGYTQETAARLCMRSTRIIGDIERGRSSVEIGIVLEYAALLGVDVFLQVRGCES